MNGPGLFGWKSKNALLVGFLLLCTHAFARLEVCYSPSGAVLSGDRPCFPDADQSHCCAVDWVCSTNLLCIQGPKVQLNSYDPSNFRSSCTDKNWNTNECAGFCKGDTTVGVFDCGNNQYCCGLVSGETDCCTRQEEIFQLPAGANITTIGGAIGPAMSSTSSTPSSTSSAPATLTDSGTSTSSTSNYPTSGPSSNGATSSPTAAASEGGMPTNKKVAISVSVSVVVLTIIVAIAVLFFRRKSKPQYQTPNEVVFVYEKRQPMEMDALGAARFELDPDRALSAHHPRIMGELEDTSRIQIQQHGSVRETRT